MRYQRNRIVVRCDSCPGQPILSTATAVDLNLCVRCQGEERRLPWPHPEDHLCAPCRRECPECRAPSPKGGTCLACQGVCWSCRAPLPVRPVGEVEIKEPRSGRGGASQWSRAFFPRSWGNDLCDACREGERSADPVRAVLAAFPPKLLSACGGTAPPAAVSSIRVQLQQYTVAQLAARVERRWWGGWASRPLSRKATDTQDGYGPDDVALALISPPACPARCDDGWVPGDPDRPCPACLARRAQERDGEEEPQREAFYRDAARAPGPAPAARTTAEALAHRPPLRECEGRGGTCGVPVADPYTQCPACSDWPTCACGRRYDPSRGTACPTCSVT
ncbi:hypothetical protein FNX44_005475 [Streptomyces sp. OF1]|uniref:Uncharacterized protein n=1 Tax=Streptomyces alkaliterrae TaxID=2213162 RepID=A0A5P0YLW2_9ACTN|nr:hypothetical protein [Streptomyces alkaliterrae]